MKKKLLLLIGFIFVITGCTAEYELTYEDDIFSEHVVITEIVETNSDEFMSISSIDENSHYIKLDENNKYDFNLKRDNGKNILTLDFEFKDVSFEKSRFYNDCFKYRTFIDGDDYYYIKLEGESVCEYLKEVDIVFKTDKYVYDTNAQEKDEEKGIYKWKNFNGGEIIIQVSKTETLKSYNDNQSVEFIPWYVKLIVSGIVVLVVFIIYRKIKKDQID